MKRTVVLLAAVAVLAGCGSDTAVTSAEEPTTATSSEVPTEEPAESTEEPEGSEKPEDEPEPDQETAVPADAPACAAVWQDGTRLARDYAGCTADGEYVPADQEPCSFGQRLVRYADRFYAVRGGPVNRTEVTLEKDRTYRGAVASCRG